MAPDQLLQRIARTLREDIGPAVDADYPRTQAFMAAVVLQKLGRQLALADEHRLQDATDLLALQADLQTMTVSLRPPDALAATLQAVAHHVDAAGLCRLIEALYVHRAALARQVPRRAGPEDGTGRGRIRHRGGQACIRSLDGFMSGWRTGMPATASASRRGVAKALAPS